MQHWYVMGILAVDLSGTSGLIIVVANKIQVSDILETIWHFKGDKEIYLVT